MANKTQKRDPDQTYSHGGKLYGPNMPAGQKVADLDKLSPMEMQSTGPTDAEGQPVVNEQPLETGSVSKTGAAQPHESSASRSTGGTALGADQLEGMSKADLAEHAALRGVTVTGAKGAAPTKADYVEQLDGR